MNARGSFLRVRAAGRVLFLMMLVVVVVLAGTPATATRPADHRVSVGDVEFIGSTEFATGYTFGGTEVGGLSGMVYDGSRDVYYALSDDKSEVDPARYYSLTIDLSDGTLDDGDIAFVDVTFLRDKHGRLFAEGSLDPEGFELVGSGQLFIGSEPSADTDPWLKRFNLAGKENRTLRLPRYYLPQGDPQTVGVRSNLGFESVTVTPTRSHLYAANESALVQDGPIASQVESSPARVLEYSRSGLKTGREFVYVVEPIPVGSLGSGDNGLTELQSLDDAGTFLAMERSFVGGFGNTIRLFETSFAGATNVAGIDDLDGISYTPMSKELVLDLGTGEYEGITLDNLEGMAFGPQMPDGRYPLILVADNNFNAPFQRTLFLAFAVELVES